MGRYVNGKDTIFYFDPDNKFKLWVLLHNTYIQVYNTLIGMCV